MDHQQADSKYTVFLDGDDRLEPDFLETLYKAAEENDADMTVCAYDRVDVQSQKVLFHEIRGFPPLMTDADTMYLLPFMNTSLWNRLIRTDLLSDTRLPDVRIGEDSTFVFRLYRRCRRIAVVERELIHYQVRRESAMFSIYEGAIHEFAAELQTQLAETEQTAYHDVLALAVFIHIGISMLVLAQKIESIDIKKHLVWTRKYLRNNGLLRGTAAAAAVGPTQTRNKGPCGVVLQGAA